MKHLKTFETHSLNESQVIEMDKGKDDFLKCFGENIKEIQNGVEEYTKPASTKLKELYYKLLTNFSSNLSFKLDDDVSKKSEKLFKILGPHWEKRFYDNYGYFNNKKVIVPSDTASAWQRFFINQDKLKSEDDLTNNYYLTIDNDPNNVKNFYNKLDDLYEMIIKLSNDTKASIHFKFPRELKRFVSHNDNLKFYAYPNWETGEKGNIKNIKKSVDMWLQKNDIKTSDRTHNLAFDSKEHGTFGQILSKYLTYVTINTINKHKDNSNFTIEKLYNSLNKQLPKVISDFSKNAVNPEYLIKILKGQEKFTNLLNQPCFLT